MSLSGDLYRAVGKSLLGRYAVYLFNILSLMLLARIFSPEVFGLVAAISVFYTFFQVMAEAGIGPAVINLSKLSNVDRDGLFGLTSVLGVALGLLFYMLSPVFVSLYRVEQIDEVVPFVAVAIFFFGLAMVPTAFLLRDQAYFRIANAGVLAEIFSTAMVCIAKEYVDPLQALASKLCISAIVNFVCVYFFSARTEFGRPRWGAKFSAVQPLLLFSSYQFGFNFVNYFSRNLDNILVGRYMGAAFLGVYEKAYQLMRYPLLLLTFAMTPAIQPALRKHAGNRVILEKVHRQFLFRLSLAGALVALVTYFFAEKIVFFLLGPQWSAVSPIIKILAVAIPVQIVMSTSGSFFQALNRPDLLFYSGCLIGFTMIISMVIGISQHSLIVLSWFLVGAFCLNFFVIYFIIYRHGFMLSAGGFFLKMVPMLFITILMLTISLF